MSQFISYQIKCRFCGVQTGTIDVPMEKAIGNVITDEVAGVVDSRCDDCKLSYGTFQDMETAFMRDTDATYEEFRDALHKSDYKSRNFTEALLIRSPHLVAADHDIPEIAKHIKAINKEMGLEGESSSIKVKIFTDLKKQGAIKLDRTTIDTLKTNNKKDAISPTA